jgi:hypothetical protein
MSFNNQIEIFAPQGFPQLDKKNTYIFNELSLSHNHYFNRCLDMTSKESLIENFANQPIACLCSSAATPLLLLPLPQ